METCCFGTSIHDLEPVSWNPRDTYQQFEINKRDRVGYVAKSVAPDGCPPRFLRRKGWSVLSSTIHDFELQEAAGLDENLRAHLPDFNFPWSRKSSIPVVVGKWYRPFIFMKEGNLEDQINRFRYYEMTLEQRWEQIFAHEIGFNELGNAVSVDAVVETEMVVVGGVQAKLDETNVVDGAMVWYRRSGGGVGLSMAIVERIRWEQQRTRWNIGNERQIKVKRVEEYGGKGEWRKFGCYLLVERSVLKRMDGSLVPTHDFKHTNQIRNKWE